MAIFSVSSMQPSIICIPIIHCVFPSICVVAFATAPHKLPSAYMASYKASQVNPREWLTDIIARLPYYTRDKKKT
jgi:hypothetical protein